MTVRLVLLVGAIAAAAIGGPAGAEELVRISRQDCARLTRHQPAPDTTYKPGVDVRGNAVAPADLGGGAHLNLPQELNIPIELEAASGGVRRGQPGRYDGKAQIGVVTVRDGAVLFNGQPMSEFDQHLVAAACRARIDR